MEKTQILEALDRAIQAEQSAQSFYRASAEKTRDPGGAQMFRELAEFEAHHEAGLKELKSSLESAGRWMRYTPREFTKVPAAEGKGRRSTADDSDSLEALRIAIAAEERAISEYDALAKAAPDDAGREMFRRLSDEEAMHRRLLDDQYYALLNRGVWVWGD